MVGNLLLARQLPEREFALLALFLAFVQIGTTFGTAGAETLVVRHHLRPGGRLLRTLGGCASLVGVALLAVCHVFYGMNLWLAGLTFAAVVASSLVRVEAAFYQSSQNFRAALILHQGYNVALLAIAVLALWLGTQTAMLPSLLMAICFIAMAVYGWLAAERAKPATAPLVAYPWREALPVIGFGAASILSLQSERLLIPQLLSVELVATYSVLAALAGSPFQMLMMGVGYTMLPRLRNSRSASQRRGIVRKELLLILVVVLPSAALVLLLSPYFATLLTDGKYTLTTGLVGAAVLTGLGRVFNGFVTALLRALGGERELRWMNYSAWLGIAVAVLAAIPAARYGLVGIVLANSIGWLLRLVALLPASFRVLSRGTVETQERG